MRETADPLLAVPEAAAHLGVTERFVRRHARIRQWCEPYASLNSASATRRVASAASSAGTCW